MHRTNRVQRPVLWGVLLVGGLFGGHVGVHQTAHAQPAAAPSATQKVDIPVNGTQLLQMTGPTGQKTNIKTVINEREQIARVQAVATDPTVIQVTGLQIGTTKITVIDVDNNQRVFEVNTTIDLPYLRRIIQQAVPTADVRPIPASNTSIILTGTVAKAEDVEIVLRTAAGVLRGLVFSGLPAGAGAAPGGAGGGPAPGGGIGGGGIGGGAVGGIGAQGNAGQLGMDIINALRVGGVMQVQLDVVVALVNRSEVRQMSFDFNENGVRHVFNSSQGQAFRFPQPNTGLTGSLLAPQIFNQVGTPNGNPSNIFLGIFGNNQGFLGFLQALENDSLGKILSQPRLTTLSGRPAQLVSGGEQPVPAANGLGTTTIDFRPFGTILEFLPVVMGNGRIYLEVEATNSQLDPASGLTLGGLTIAGRLTQRVRTTVELEEGQTLAVGGLIEHVTNGTIIKVPVIGDLPFLGAFFSTKTFTDAERELVFMVTPHLVDGMDCTQLPKLLPGQETRKPDDFELFLEGILEAPRGPRVVYPNGHYKAAWHNGPSANLYPCAGVNSPDGGLCGAGGCNGCNGSAIFGGQPGCASCGGSRCMDAQAGGTMGATPAAMAPVTVQTPATTVVLPPSVSDAGLPPVTTSVAPAAVVGDDARPAELPAVNLAPSGPLGAPVRK